MFRLKTNQIKAILTLSVLFCFVFFAPLGALASDITKNSIIILVNESRLKNGLAPVKENPVLSAVAKDKVEDMIANNYFAHNSPQGKDPWFWFAKNGYEYSAAGENLAINFTSAEAQHQQWINSESHRKNILNPKYSEIGIAVASGKINGKETIITAQVFAAPLVGVVSQKPLPENGKVLPAQDAKVSVPEIVPSWKTSFNTFNLGLALGIVIFVNILAVVWVRVKKDQEELMLHFYLISQVLAQD